MSSGSTRRATHVCGTRGTASNDQFQILFRALPVSLFAQSLGIESNVLGVSVSPLRDSFPATFALCGPKHRAFRSVAGLVENQPSQCSLLLNATKLMIRLTSVRVKDKACIYNHLQPRGRDRLHRMSTGSC